MTQPHSLFDKRTLPIAGLAAGIGAGMIFATDFLPAQVLKDVSPLEFYIGRTLFFGMAGLFFCRPALAAFRKFTGRERLKLLAMNACGFWLYSLMLFWSIQHGSAVVTAMVIGAIPAAIALVSKPLRALGAMFGIGLALIVAGLAALNADAMHEILRQQAQAWLLPFGCLVIWTWYAVANADFVKKHPEMTKTDMVSIMGLMTFAVMALPGLFLVDATHILHHPQLGAFVLLSALLGLGSSWIGFWLWNVCALHCPPTVSGPILVSEPVFGLLYTFLWQHRLPERAEAAAIALFFAGALLVVRAETRAE